VYATPASSLTRCPRQARGVRRPVRRRAPWQPDVQCGVLAGEYETLPDPMRAAVN